LRKFFINGAHRLDQFIGNDGVMVLNVKKPGVALLCWLTEALLKAVATAEILAI